jgi:(4S)-4-hydroxy-5-phosphonooxypentane-2,3-dione isomerase
VSAHHLTKKQQKAAVFGLKHYLRRIFLSIRCSLWCMDASKGVKSKIDMIKRVVKMTFEPHLVSEFLAVFEDSKNFIRAFQGCEYLELWQDANQPNVLFTFSHWRSETDLEQYRKSELFYSTWAKTKPLFAAKAEAWTIHVLSENR